MKLLFRYTLLAAIGTLIIVGINLIVPTYLNGYTPFYTGANSGIVEGNLIIEVVEYHRTHAVFGLRPFVTYPVLYIAKYTPVPLGAAFVLVQAIYIWGALLLLLLLQRLLVRESTNKKEVYTLIGFITSFSVLFSYAAPVYAYDDFLQYLLLFAAWILGRNKHWLLYTICMTLALLVRESTLLVLPAFGLLLVPELLDGPITTLRKGINWLRLSIIGIVPVALYSAFMYIVSLSSTKITSTLRYTSTERFDHFAFNFQNSLYSIESVVGFFLVFAIPFYLLYRFRSVVPTPVRTAFFLTLLINTPIAYLATRVQEVRILAFPLIFLWPFFGVFISQYFLALRTDIKTIWHRYKHISIAALIEVMSVGVLAALLTCIVYGVLFQQTNTGSFHSGYQVYGMISIGIIILPEMLRKLTDQIDV